MSFIETAFVTLRKVFGFSETDSRRFGSMHHHTYSGGNEMIKKLSAALLISALTLSLAACGGNDKDKSSSAGASSGQGASNPGKKTTVTLLHWQQPNINAAIEKINKGFEEAYPQYKVEYVKTEPNEVYKQAYKAHMTAHDIDIFADLAGMRLAPEEWSPGAAEPDWKVFIDSGLIADLSNEPFVKNYDPNAISVAGTYKGKVYGIPTGSYAMGGFFFNKKIFEDNGLKVPTTWNEFIAVCDALLAKGVTPIGLAGKDVWPLKLPVFNLQAQLYAGGDQQAFAKGIWTGDHKFNDPDAVEVLDKMKLIQDKYTINGFMGIGYGDLPQIFATGKVAMIADGTWDIGTIEAANKDLDFGYFPLPATDKPVDVMAGKYDMTWYVAESGPNKAGALAWLEYFSRPEVYAAFANEITITPSQPNVKMDNKVLNDYVTPWASKVANAFELIMINRENIGETLQSEGVHTELLTSGAPYKTAKELADKQQQQWEAANPRK